MIINVSKLTKKITGKFFLIIDLFGWRPFSNLANLLIKTVLYIFVNVILRRQFKGIGKNKNKLIFNESEYYWVIRTSNLRQITWMDIERNVNIEAFGIKQHFSELMYNDHWASLRNCQIETV